ncbi:MAG: hypothetical protein RR359_01840, partial [Bacilli bacterium]
HVLGMPPAFILSQDQTLKILIIFIVLIPSYSIFCFAQFSKIISSFASFHGCLNNIPNII